MAKALTRDQGIEHLTDRLITLRSGPLDVDIPATFGIEPRDYYTPEAEALYDIFTSTTPQARFPQHGVNLIRLNAKFNIRITEAFLDRQLALWKSGQWVTGLANAL